MPAVIYWGADKVVLQATREQWVQIRAPLSSWELRRPLDALLKQGGDVLRVTLSRGIAEQILASVGIY